MTIRYITIQCETCKEGDIFGYIDEFSSIMMLKEWLEKIHEEITCNCEHNLEVITE